MANEDARMLAASVAKTAWRILKKNIEMVLHTGTSVGTIIDTRGFQQNIANFMFEYEQVRSRQKYAREHYNRHGMRRNLHSRDTSIGVDTMTYFWIRVAGAAMLCMSGPAMASEATDTLVQRFLNHMAANQPVAGTFDVRTTQDAAAIAAFEKTKHWRSDCKAWRTQSAAEVSMGNRF